jgi:hypothetical protein
MNAAQAIPVMFPTVFIVQNVTGGAARLSGIAKAILTSITDLELTDGEVLPQHFVILQNSNHDKNIYRGMIHFDMFITRLSNIYGIDPKMLLQEVNMAVEEQISNGIDPGFIITSTNLGFKTLQLVYRKIAELRPQDFAPNTLAFAINQLDIMIAESHPVMGLDDIGNLLASDELSTVATWRLVTGNIGPEAVEDGEGGAHIRRVGMQVGAIYSSDVYSAVFDIAAWNRQNDQITKAIMFGDLSQASIVLNRSFRHVLDGVNNPAERLRIARDVQATFNSYVSELSGLVAKSDITQVLNCADDTALDSKHAALSAMLASGELTTQENTGGYILKWDGLPTNPLSKLQSGIMPHIANTVHLYSDLRLVVGEIAGDYLGGIQLDTLCQIICKVWEFNPAAMPVPVNHHVALMHYLLDVLHSSNFNAVDDRFRAAFKDMLPSSDQTEITNQLIDIATFLVLLFGAPLGTRFTDMSFNGLSYGNLGVWD